MPHHGFASLPWFNLFLSILLQIHLTDGLSAPASATKSATKAADLRQSSTRPTIFPNSVPVQPSDIATLMRQTGQVNPSKAAIGVPATCACQHGFPQAFAMDPLYAGRINSGLLKLTCPLLVRAVDALEDDGMIQTLTERLLMKDNNTLPAEIHQSHAQHAEVRKMMVSTLEVEQIQSKLGMAGSEAFLNAGVAGASPGSTDLKCLHAWLADALFAGDTRIGSIIRQELEAKGVDLTGTASCQTNCDPTSSAMLADPPKPRNKQRLRTNKEVERRKRRKKELQLASEDK